MNWKPWSVLKKAAAKWAGKGKGVAKTEDGGRRTKGGGRKTRRTLRRMSERMRPDGARGWRLPVKPAQARRMAMCARFWGKIEARLPLEVRAYPGRKCPRCRLRTTAADRRREREKGVTQRRGDAKAMRAAAAVA